MATLTKDRKDRLLEVLVAPPVWVGLMTEDKVEIGARQKVAFGEPQDNDEIRFVQNERLVRFPAFREDPGGAIVYWFLTDSHEGEGYYMLVRLDEPREARRGDAPIFEAGDLTIAIP